MTSALKTSFIPSIRRSLASTLALSVLAGVVVIAQCEESQAKVFAANYERLTLNPLEFANRAGCGVKSTDPAQSALVIVDGYIAGKLAYSLAKATGGDPAQIAQEGMTKFRLTLSNLVREIQVALLSSRAPMLPSDLSSSSLFGAILKKKCSGEEYCPAFDPVLKKLWNSESKWNGGDASIRPLGFVSGASATCRYLKSFSSLQSQLAAQEPSLLTLERIAQDTLAVTDVFGSCGDPSLESRSFVLQLDLMGLNPKSWKREGFDFWNSLRIYLSWAWRNLPLEQFGAGEFSQAFRSIALEETLLFAPNGCASIIAPSCDSQFIATASLRDLALGSADSMRELPHGPQEALSKNPTPAVNQDLLKIQDSKSLGEWVGQFRKRLVGNSLLLKNRFNDALNRLAILAHRPSGALGGAELLQDISVARVKDSRGDAARKELYALCAEYQYAVDRDFGVLREDLSLLSEVDFLKGAVTPWSRSDVESYLAFYSLISAEVLQACKALDQERFWHANSTSIDPSLYQPWMREALADAGVTPGLVRGADDQRERSSSLYTSSNASSIIRIRNAALGVDEVVCRSAIDCARQVLSSMIDLHAALTYAQALLPLGKAAPGTPLFNPYAERVACKTYDPWFKTRKSVKEFVVDLANTAVFGWNPLPVFFSVDVQQGEVHSLKKLVQDGKLVFDSKANESRTKHAWVLGMDAGPLVGVPCTVAITNGARALSALSPYYFDGISLAACGSNEKHRLEVSSASSAEKLAGLSGASCVTCHMNFSSLSTVSAVTGGIGPFNPVKLGVYLIHAFARLFKNLDDKNDIPRYWTVDANEVALTYLKHGHIPKQCYKPLSRGKSCQVDSCASEFSNKLASGIQGMARPIATRDLGDRSFETDYLSSACGGVFKVRYADSFWGCKFLPSVEFNGTQFLTFSATEDCDEWFERAFRGLSR
ncbi:MAG: hypothetical protein RJB38_1045 [Pseudomonadota bacterium]